MNTYTRNRIVDALGKIRLMARNIREGNYNLAKFNLVSAADLLHERSHRMNDYTVTFETRTLQDTIRIRHIQVEAVDEVQAIRKARYKASAACDKLVSVVQH